MRKSLFAGFVCAVVLLSSSAALAAENWIGTWKLNVAKSKATPGPGPKSQTLKFTSSPAGITLASEGVMADGSVRKGSYTSKWDGKDVPWTGNPDADMAAPMKVDDNTYTNAWKRGGKAVITAKVVVSADGKTLTVTQEGKNAKGEAMSSTGVYDKQ
ncbi:MAG: hypothetical protein ABI584_12350 [Acidobacteriota bacterium]